MNSLRIPLFLTFVAAILCIAGASTATAAPDAADSTTPPRELAIVVVESLVISSGSSTPFDYLHIAFHNVAKARKWPAKLIVERLAGNTADRPTELRIFYKGLDREPGDRLVLRTWATLTDQGKEHDFGIVTVNYLPRPGEPNEEAIEKLYRRMAEAIAAKIEPLLFPKP